MRKGLSFPKSLFFYSCTIILGTASLLLGETNLQRLLSHPLQSLGSLCSFAMLAYAFCLPLWLVILPYFGVFGNWQRKLGLPALLCFNAGFGLLLGLGWALMLQDIGDLGFFLPFIMAACVSGIFTALLFHLPFRKT
ncbi:MAG TPA: hypothetical protein DCG19_11600 [Cryomorphaceae bacterium]|nr:hypothetical protein [Owenweeksia sp.]MBF97948.1 hypothetical protein [Owenweeksia sp.]HAD98043.1 hypothetical protein [Cryomorphaceae bacterium]HBF18531.1 hypothetical protein [Cryomorphaceae bacterium]HCQ14916.1 hypothetical protein [Cryomorphaceae bacterium]|tara:strand:+ start:927 stop:1337 length:411 start_codon:yes stop_codon:yes gene_type:complete